MTIYNKGEIDMEFVNYEIAKKLKEKGFIELCLAYYTNDDTLYYNYSHRAGACYRDCYLSHNFMPKDSVSGKFVDAPTISQVLKWLREVKGIDVLPQRGHINIDNNGKVTRYYNVNIYFERWFACTLDNDEQDYSTFEQAAIAGIEYVLDNII